MCWKVDGRSSHFSPLSTWCWIIKGLLNNYYTQQIKRLLQEARKKWRQEKRREEEVLQRLSLVNSSRFTNFSLLFYNSHHPVADSVKRGSFICSATSGLNIIWSCHLLMFNQQHKRHLMMTIIFLSNHSHHDDCYKRLFRNVTRIWLQCTYLYNIKRHQLKVNSGSLSENSFRTSCCWWCWYLGPVLISLHPDFH